MHRQRQQAPWWDTAGAAPLTSLPVNLIGHHGASGHPKTATREPRYVPWHRYGVEIRQRKEHHMTTDLLKARWTQLRGEIKKRWGELTDDEVVQINGERDKLAGLIQERYALTKEEALEQIDRFLEHLNERLDQ